MSSNDLTREEWRQKKDREKSCIYKTSESNLSRKTVAPGTYGKGIQRRDD